MIYLILCIPFVIATNGHDLFAQTEMDTKYVNNGQSILLICDLPSSMPDGKVLFIKYDKRKTNEALPPIDIREGTDERYELNQQYAWEWSLKINSITEDDSAIYVCQVGDVVIKKFDLIVRVPPRINDNIHQERKVYEEGSNVEFKCTAKGTPRPRIQWFVHDSELNLFKKLETNSEILRIENVTRHTSRFYQCRANNGIPPTDTKNLTFSIEFAPEIQIQAKYDHFYNTMNINCTITAYPLSNKNYWTKDGSYVYDSEQTQIFSHQVNYFTLVSIMRIKNYDDQINNGLYECIAENNLKVSKMVYNLNKDFMLESSSLKQNMIQIGSSLPNSTLYSKINKHYRKNKLGYPSSTLEFFFNKNKYKINNTIESSSINNYMLNDKDASNVRKQQQFYQQQVSQYRNIKTTTRKRPEMSSNPFLLLINEGEPVSREETHLVNQQSLFSSSTHLEFSLISLVLCLMIR